MDATGTQDKEEILVRKAGTGEEAEAHVCEHFLPCGEAAVDVAGASQVELDHCAAQVGSLLWNIAEPNEMMCSLETNRDAPCVTSPASDCSRGGMCSAKPASQNEKAGTDGLWEELQAVLCDLESSAVEARTWAASYKHCDATTAKQHLTAANEICARVAQVLEELEGEIGISYPSALPPKERQRFQRELLALHQHMCSLRATLLLQEDELERSKVTLSGLEDEKNKLQLKLLDLQRNVPAGGSLSPPISPTSGSTSSSETLSCASPPYPASPVPPKRTLSSSAPPCSRTATPTSSTFSVTMATERERLHRSIERLKVRNERLTAALERRKGESEQMSMILNRHEADNTALQMALQYSEECEEAMAHLLTLYAARKQSAESDGKIILSQTHKNLRTEESVASTECPPGGDGEAFLQKREVSSVPDGEEALRLLERIQRLKQDRATLYIPQQKPEGEGKLSPDTGTLAPNRGHDTGSQNPRREKAVLTYELVTVREEMSELRAMIRLTDKKKRYVDWSLTAQRVQDVAGALVADCLREELGDARGKLHQLADRETGQDWAGGIPNPSTRAMLREIQATLQREQALKRRVLTLRDSLGAVLADSVTRRRYCEDEMAQLSLAHSQSGSTYRSIRRKYQQQLWRLERQVISMSERHAGEIRDLKATLESLERGREDTAL